MTDALVDGFVLDNGEQVDVTADQVGILLGAHLVYFPEPGNRHYLTVPHDVTLDHVEAYLKLPVDEILATELRTGDLYEWYGRWSRANLIVPTDLKRLGDGKGGGFYVTEKGRYVPDRVPATQHLNVVRAATYRRFRSSSTYIDGFEHEREFGLYVPDVCTDDQFDLLLQVESGAGHFGPNGESVDAYYEIRSIDGLEPHILWEAQG